MQRRSKRSLSVIVVVATVGVLAFAGFAVRRVNVSAAELARVEDGFIHGVYKNGVVAFLGIPYAEPPVGGLRWRPPQPLSVRPDVLETTRFQADCMQPASETGQPAATSEDCLYLNVWRPSGAANVRLPVMVWIHGGGLVRGGASLYPGDRLARQGIVVVSLNYRLGRLGFFAHPQLAREVPGAPRGNYGYMDQLAALQWVKRNIAAFGGDPNNVTIAGESAGGGSVLVLLTAPAARGLFQRAILQSPGIPTARADATPMRDLASAELIALDYSRMVTNHADGATAIAALRALPAERLVQGTEKYVLAMMGGPEIPGLSHAIIDGQLVVEPPEHTLRARRMSRVPIIVGANDFDLATSPAATKEALFAKFGRFASHARALYDLRGDRPFEDLTQEINADGSMVEPSRNLAELMAVAGLPAYFYRFSYVPESLRLKERGAAHGAEIPFTMDLIGGLLNGKETEADEETARIASGYWTAFVRTGNPNGENRPAWPRYDPTVRNVLEFTRTGVTYGADPLRARLDLWRTVRESACAGTTLKAATTQRGC